MEKTKQAHDTIVTLSAKMTGLSMGEARVYDQAIAHMRDFILSVEAARAAVIPTTLASANPLPEEVV